MAKTNELNLAGMPKNVLILCGGRSEEHEISLISAKHILDALDRSRFNPLVVGISREGTWFLEKESNFFVGEPRADQIVLNTDAPTVSVVPFASREGRGKLQAEGRVLEFDVVFPVLHGPFGEDGTLQGFLEILNIPYVGATCGSSWLCMDKALCKVLCRHCHIQVTDFVWVESLDELSTKSSEIEQLGNTVFVKPSRLGSSVGISKVTRKSDLEKAVALALKYDTKCLIERAIAGREIECAVLGLNGAPRVAQPGEIVPNKKIGFYSYEAKYLMADGAQLLFPAPLDAKMTKAVQDFSLKVFKVLEIDGMARIDLFLEESTGKIYLSEANTIPGFTPISMYPKLWQISGLPYPNLITELIHLAFQRLGKNI